jgi:hypothetical protein
MKISKGIKSLSLFLIVILWALFSSSCGVSVKPMSKQYISVERGAIPPDFGVENSTLLCIAGNKGYTKYLVKNFESLYRRDFKVIEKNDLQSDDYDDKEKYRFVFDFYDVSKVHTNSNGSTTRSSKKFFIIDRKDDKKYYCQFTTAYYSKLQKVYIEKLNDKILAEKN